MMRRFLVWCWGIILLVGGVGVEAQSHKGSRPAFILLNGAQLAAYKAAYQKGSPAETKQVQVAVAAAQKALTHGPYTIVRKTQTPPTGDKHDYMSQAPYSWPDPSKPDGLPYLNRDGLHYLNRDGLRNLEAAAFTDEDNMLDMTSDVKKLAVAYYFTGKEEYAAKAARQLRGFFLDPATRMHPNLNFAQAIPGLYTGRCYGMIETRNLVEIPDALALLADSKSIDTELVSGLQGWFRQFTNWALTSPLGSAEGRVENNHGTFYDSEVVDFALFTGDEALARKVLETQTKARLATQLQPDGAQPLELARTRPWNYVTMNMLGWVRLARLAEKVNIDLWHYTSSDGRSLHAGVAWLKPYLLKEKQMERADVVPISNQTALLLYDKAGQHYPDLAADKVFALYPDHARLPWTL